MNQHFTRVILTDADGVLLNWEQAFHTWMFRKGYKLDSENAHGYDMGARYGINSHKAGELIEVFNESASIGNVPPFKDAIKYVTKLHREHGYVFNVITAMSLDRDACELRRQSLKSLFGKTTFDEIVFVGCGADKRSALEPYKDTGLLWVEDKVENAILGHELGLESVLLEHSHNTDTSEISHLKRFPNWKSIYNHVIGDN